MFAPLVPRRPAGLLRVRTRELANRSRRLTAFWLLSLSMAAGAVAAPPTTGALVPLKAPPSIDGAIAEGEWAGALTLALEHQVDPDDSRPATEKTLAFVGRDGENLYLAFMARDSEPSLVRAHVTKRDSIEGDDWVSLILDTDGQRQRAYQFRFNPFGIQQDGIYTEADSENLTWDGVIESRGGLTPDGYVVEARIPFRSLRYTAGEDAVWGAHLMRWIARKAERTSWAPITRDESSRIAQMGALTGLGGITRRRTFEVVPTITGSVSGTPVDDSRGRRLRSARDLSPGLTGFVALTPRLALSAAINPDFSQVESDVPQISVNQRFPLFFPEKRPFFLEGEEYFRPIAPGAFRLFDSRSIVDPDWGLKLTGRLGGQSIAFITASDRAPGLRVASSSAEYGEKAQTSVVSISRNVRGESNVGIFVTDRRFGGSSNSAFMAQTRQIFRSVNTLTFNAAYSITRLAPGRPAAEGWATRLRWNTVARGWKIYAHHEHVSRDFAAQAGFLRRVDYNEFFGDVGYEWRSSKPDSWWTSLWPYVLATRSHHTDGSLEYQYVDPAIQLIFAKNLQFNAYWSFDNETFGGRRFSYNFKNVRLQVNRFKRVVSGTTLQFGEGLLFDPERPQVGRALQFTQGLTFKPSSALSSEFQFVKSRLSSARDGSQLSQQTIFRNRTAYQFAATHAFRSIVDYDTASRRFGLSALYSWTPEPTTSIYLGYNDLFLKDRDPVTNRPIEGLERAGRTFFLKISRGIRF